MDVDHPNEFSLNPIKKHRGRKRKPSLPMASVFKRAVDMTLQQVRLRVKNRAMQNRKANFGEA